jgi:arsenate reductase
VAHVLFVCVRNAGRSQMSEALFRDAVRGRHETSSAGTDPAKRVHPEVVAVMRELGIELSRRIPQHLTDELIETADVVVTMGCGDACPVLPGKRYVEWDLSDPEGRPLEDVRLIRDEIATRVAGLVTHLNAPS